MKSRLTTLGGALVAALAAGSASAAIAPGTSGNGELLLAVVDDAAKVSYVRDLGIRMDDVIGGTGAPTASGLGNSNWSVSFDLSADTYYQSFLGLSNPATTRWAIVAIDSTGNLNPNQQRLVSTAYSEPGKTAAQIELTMENGTNLNFTNGIGATQAGNFYNAINDDGSHAPQNDYDVDGSSIAFETDDGRAYFGEAGGLTPNFNGGTTFRSTNDIGVDSFLFYVTRSSTSSTGKVVSTAFANAGGYTIASFDGTELSITTAVPEPGTYAMLALGLMAVGASVRRRL